MDYEITGFLGSALPCQVLAKALPGEGISERQFIKQVVLDPNVRREGSLLAHRDLVPKGYCLAIARQVPLENAPDDSDRGYLTLLGVDPGERRRGIGSALLDRAEEYLRGQNRKSVWISSYAPGYFTPGVDVAAYSDGLRFLLGRDYREVYRPVAMQTDLWNIQVPDWVTELASDHLRSILSYHAVRPTDQTLPDLIGLLLDFVGKHFPGDWVRVVREACASIVDGDASRGLWVALGESGIVGFSHFHRERFGPIGVAESERGRGIGQVLTLKTLESQRDAGYRTAWFMWSDDRTAARLYNHFGFREARRFALLRKDL